MDWQATDNEMDRANQLDIIAEKRKEKSWMDEIVCGIILAPIVWHSIYYAWMGTPEQMWQSYALVPVWYIIFVGAVVITVLGLRGMARAGFKAYKNNLFRKK